MPFVTRLRRRLALRLLPASLLNRVFLLFATALTLMLSAGLGVALRGYVLGSIEDANATATMIVEIAAQSVSDAALVNDHDAITRTLRAAVLGTPFGRARFIGLDRSVIEQRAAPQHAPVPQALRAYLTEQLPEVNRVIVAGGRDYGVLRLDFQVDRLAEPIWQTLLNSLVFGVAALAAGLALTRWLLGRWLSPLAALDGLVERIRQGQFDAHASAAVDAPAEVRRAIEQFNSATGGLRDGFGRRIDALSHSLEQLKMATDQAVIVVELKPDGTIDGVNEMFCRVSGLAQEAVIGRRWLWGLRPEVLAPGRDPRAPAGGVWQGEVACEGTPGRIVWVKRAVVPIRDEHDRLARFISLDIDVTREHHARHQLRRLSLAVEHAASAILITDPNGRIEYANPTFTRMTGFAFAAIRGQTPRFLKSGDVPAETYDEMWRAMREGRTWRGELTNRRVDGSTFWCALTLSSVLDRRGRVRQFISVMEDATERRKAQETIHRLAYFDALTALPNRRMFMERAVEAVKVARARETSMAMCYLDLDGFKNVNDTLGHHVGDALLTEVARRIKACLAPADFLGRLGGDEFALLLHDARDPERVAAVGRAIIEALGELTAVAGEEIHIGTSIGVSMFPIDGQDVGDLLRKADMALYKAKELGKRQLVFFTSEIEERKRQRAELEAALALAQHGGQLQLLFQPKIDIGTQAAM
ncbi:MAG: diguanylate cyclase, partial [Rubrivivax sp.]